MWPEALACPLRAPGFAVARRVAILVGTLGSAVSPLDCFPVDKSARKPCGTTMLTFAVRLTERGATGESLRSRSGYTWLSRTRRFMPRPDSSVVERGPEKAGVGGSIPSLATTSTTSYKPRSEEH